MRSPNDLDEQVQDMAHRLDADIAHRVADQLARFRVKIAGR
jgi:hypothetical protein